MVLVAFVMVILAAVTFAAGIAASRTNDALVYVSIAFSLGAFVILAIASLRARQATRPIADAEPVAPDHAIDETQAHAGPLLGGLEASQLDMTPSWRRRRQQAAPVEPEEAEEPEEVDEQLEDEEDEADFEVPVFTPELDWGREDDEEQEPTAAFSLKFDDQDEDEEEEEEAQEAIALDDEEEEAEAGEGSLFDQYDDLTASEILPTLSGLDLDGLKWVRSRERAGAKRATVLNRVDQLIAEGAGGRPAPRKRAPVKKKAAAKKKAAPARRAAKKSTGRR